MKEEYSHNVVGVSFKNEGGSSRQEIIGKMSEGDVVKIIPDPTNKYDPNALAVYWQKQQIGFLSKDIAKSWKGIITSEVSGVVTNFKNSSKDPTKFYGLTITYWIDTSMQTSSVETSTKSSSFKEELEGI